MTHAQSVQGIAAVAAVAGAVAAASAMPRLFSSDFARKVSIDDGQFQSMAPRGRRDGAIELAMTGNYGYEPDSRRHAVEYLGSDGRTRWLSVTGRTMAAPGVVRSTPVRFTDGSVR